MYIVKGIWIASPSSPEDVEELANWAFENKYILRPVGAQHAWSPLVITPQDSRRTKTILIDTKKYLTTMKLIRFPRELL